MGKTWSRGTNSRLPFGVKVNLNLPILSFYLSFLYRCVTSMVYYGLGFNSGNLAGNFYLNFAASGLVEIPAYLLATYLVEK